MTIKDTVKTVMAKLALRHGNTAQADRRAVEVTADKYKRAAKRALSRIHSGKDEFIQEKFVVPGTENRDGFHVWKQLNPVIIKLRESIANDDKVFSTVEYEQMGKDQPLVLTASFLRRTCPLSTFRK